MDRCGEWVSKWAGLLLGSVVGGPGSWIQRGQPGAGTTGVPPDARANPEHSAGIVSMGASWLLEQARSLGLRELVCSVHRGDQ